MLAISTNAMNQPEARLDSFPAPTRGWNVRDPLSNMKKGFAVLLDNFFPLPYSVEFRRGSAEWVTGIGERVNTLITYSPKTGVQEMWGFANDSLYDMSSAGAVGAAEVGSLSNDEWYCTNFGTTGGNFLLCVNGTDLMLAYNGTAWEAIDNSSTMFSITNVATSDFANLFVHKERLFYIEDASMSCWYPNVGTLGGALSEIDLSSVFDDGGYLVAGGSWSVDAGDGKDDYACFITSEGELAVYIGDDPGLSDSWGLVGVFKIGQPIGRRCLMKYGGDILILTVDGIISATAAFQRGRDEAKQLAITDVIQGAVAESGALYKGSYGWGMILFSPASMLIVSVPDTNAKQQWAMNTVTKAWGRFKGWDATCFETFNDELYFGTDGAVMKAWTGKSDNGTAITGEFVPAFDYYGTRGSSKQFEMFRPTIEWDTNPLSIKVGFDTDFRIETPTQDVSLPVSSTGGVWGTGTWNNAVWSGSVVAQSEWYTVSGLGLSGAPHMIFESAVSSARITSYDVIHRRGTVF